MLNSPQVDPPRSSTSGGSPIPILNPSPSKPPASSRFAHVDPQGSPHNPPHNGGPHNFAHNPRRALFRGPGAPNSFSASSSPVHFSKHNPHHHHLLLHPHHQNHLNRHRNQDRDHSQNYPFHQAADGDDDDDDDDDDDSPTLAAAAASSSSFSSSGAGLERQPLRRQSISRVESLPNLSQLHLKANADWSSVKIPQPRKALVVHSSVMGEAHQPAVSGTFPRTSAEAPESEDFVHEEALSELLGIIRSSSQSGWVGAESPRPNRTPYDDDEDGMDIPSLSFSPAIPRALGRSKSSDVLDTEGSRLDFVLGTPPSRAPNPLAFSCHFASIEQGAELDLFRPSPPLYEPKGPVGSLAWD